jgi:hypothetical protein
MYKETLFLKFDFIRRSDNFLLFCYAGFWETNTQTHVT